MRCSTTRSRQALSVALNQSPFLNVLPDNKVAATLKLMSRPASTKLTPDVARELCQRVGQQGVHCRIDCQPGQRIRAGIEGGELPERRPAGRGAGDGCSPRRRCWTRSAKRHPSCAASWASLWPQYRSLMFLSNRRQPHRLKLCKPSPSAKREVERQRRHRRACRTINAPSSLIRILPMPTTRWATSTSMKAISGADRRVLQQGVSVAGTCQRKGKTGDRRRLLSECNWGIG